MYKLVLIHKIIPGKLSAFERWVRNTDDKRKKQNPDYVPLKRYITVLGDLTKVVIEMEMETVPEHPIVWMENVENDGDLKDMIVPGTSEIYVLKELTIEA